MLRPTIFGDFNGIQDGAQGLSQVGLGCIGSIRDLAEKGIQLREGLPLTLSDYDELEVDGEAHFDESQRAWVVRFNYAAIRTVGGGTEAELSLVDSTSTGYRVAQPVANERNLG